jgi:hypothetical protein
VLAISAPTAKRDWEVDSSDGGLVGLGLLRSWRPRSAPHPGGTATRFTFRHRFI